MKTDPEQVRLPELPIFKKYSLALREEYARASDVLAMLERTSARVKQMVEKAEDKRRKEEETPAPIQEIDLVSPEDAEPEAPELAEVEEEEDVRPFWESDLEDDPIPPPKAPVSRSGAAAKKKPATRKKATAVRTQIVRVGDRGTPVSSHTAKPRPKAKTTKAKPKPKKAAATPRSRPKVKAKKR